MSGRSIEDTGEALGDLAYNCTPGAGTCDAKMASRAVDAAFGAAEIYTTLATGGAGAAAKVPLLAEKAGVAVNTVKKAATVALDVAKPALTTAVRTGRAAIGRTIQRSVTSASTTIERVATFTNKAAHGVRKTARVFGEEYAAVSHAYRGRAFASVPGGITAAKVTEASVNTFKRLRGKGAKSAAGSADNLADAAGASRAGSVAQGAGGSNRVIDSWGEFKRSTDGQFASKAEARVAWKVYRESSQTSKTLVIGRLDDTFAASQQGFKRRNTSGWTPAVNDAWVQGAIHAQRPVKLVSKVNKGNLLNPPGSAFPSTIFRRELHQLSEAGYRIENGWALPPSAK